MPRRTSPLTDTKIRQAKAKEKEYSLSDNDGLFLRVKPNGSKTWIFNYLKPFTKKKNKLRIGQIPRANAYRSSTESSNTSRRLSVI